MTSSSRHDGDPLPWKRLPIEQRTKLCATCGDVFSYENRSATRGISRKRWARRRYCSAECLYNRKKGVTT
jgi:hypothetical protein